MVTPAITKQILVAEDDKFSQIALMSLLKSTGAAATITEDGDKCVKEFVANPKKYSLILMDICMPKMDGYTATTEIRRANKIVKIIGLSADGDDDVVASALKAGMNSVMKKPIKKVELQNLLKSA